MAETTDDGLTKAENLVNTTVSLSPNQWEKLQEKKYKERRNISSIIREALYRTFGPGWEDNVNKPGTYDRSALREKD